MVPGSSKPTLYDGLAILYGAEKIIGQPMWTTLNTRISQDLRHPAIHRKKMTKVRPSSFFTEAKPESFSLAAVFCMSPIKFLVFHLPDYFSRARRKTFFYTLFFSRTRWSCCKLASTPKRVRYQLRAPEAQSSLAQLVQ